MKMRGAGFLLCFIGLGAVWAQVPKPCVSPAAFQTRASIYNYEENKIDRFIMTYDEVNRRKVYFEEEIEVFPGKNFYEYLILNNYNIMYTINMKSRECTRSVPRPWSKYGIPENSTFEAEYTIGGPTDSVLVQQWSDRIPQRKITSHLNVMSVKDCYPVQTTLFEAETFTSATVYNFYDVVEGIPNPNDFIPPVECQNATMVEPDARYIKLRL